MYLGQLSLPVQTSDILDNVDLQIWKYKAWTEVLSWSLIYGLWQI